MQDFDGLRCVSRYGQQKALGRSSSEVVEGNGMDYNQNVSRRLELTQ